MSEGEGLWEKAGGSNPGIQLVTQVMVLDGSHRYSINC
jgi:hypothetical protein